MESHPSDNPYGPSKASLGGPNSVGIANPSLLRDRSFLGMTATQFLGAFNDNLFKQLMLLLAIPVATSSFQQDRQAVATVVFALPFILFSGYAGYLSDRYSKRRVIVLSKVAEIVVMSLGLFAFFNYAAFGYTGLLVVLFLMGLQSAFFGPGKYGILPEMLPKEQLPRANGIILMTTFLAIIFGTATAGLLGERFVDESLAAELQPVGLWQGSLICVVIATVGTITSLWVRRLAPAKPQLKLDIGSLVIPAETRKLLLRDRPLLLALFASCIFWLVSGIAIQAVNSLGMVQLQLDKVQTSLLTASIGFGISIGAVVAGRLSHGRAEFRIVRVGLWGLVLFLGILSISTSGGTHLLGQRGCFVVLPLLGMAAGFFAIPVQVFIQDRPPKDQKGRMIAVMNFVNFIAILCSGILYGIFDRIVVDQSWPRSAIFAMMASIVLPLAIIYRPKNQDTDNEAALDNGDEDAGCDVSN